VASTASATRRAFEAVCGAWGSRPEGSMTVTDGGCGGCIVGPYKREPTVRRARATGRHGSAVTRGASVAR